MSDLPNDLVDPIGDYFCCAPRREPDPEVVVDERIHRPEQPRDSRIERRVNNERHRREILNATEFWSRLQREIERRQP